MKIEKVTRDAIIFDNGNFITYDHEQDCCELNYADFSILDKNTINYDYDFDEDLIFKSIEDAGFTFGNEGHMIFIPCYSIQNGYYTDEIDIYYNDTKVISLNAEEFDTFDDDPEMEAKYYHWSNFKFK